MILETLHLGLSISDFLGEFEERLRKREEKGEKGKSFEFAFFIFPPFPVLFKIQIAGNHLKFTAELIKL